MENELYDVVVVGAGFAGLTVARELSRQGLSVHIVEARDRIGGRTWLDHRLGRDLEIGGTWVHWTQPYVWAELTRYGLDTTPSPEPERAFWWADGRRHEGGPEELLGLIGQTNALLVQDSRKYFPEPYRPLANDDFKAIDDVSVQERIREQFPAGGPRDILESFWALNFNGPLDDAALTQALRWVALTNGDWAVSFEACATYKIVGGTAALADAMLADSGASIEHGFTVEAITDDTATVGIRSTDGLTVRARTAIVTVPLHALKTIDFEPPLPPAKAEGASLGQVSKGAKVWLRLRGEHAPFVALGGADWPLNFFQFEYALDGDTIAVGFGPDASKIDVEDPAAVQAQLERLVPGAEVVDVASHNWVADPLSGETWPMHRTGFLSTHLPAMQAAHGLVLFAGSDIANGWCGFIDGAIESGMGAALDAAIALRNNN
ncbi:NAD(P)/FAD-dependent oxidoreductase [Arthrobacter sp. ISL-69]|uniref:flavin monoamine oxidase family protein n=1 Tax=Arthrobacter sp. ISL-69 TaxID=2819113 RepID=UPI001BEA4CAC|nr:NAD(P)/FAD-dependent oxidoreductase [Arthrobacter sp. ISL-69]MBT2534643.1 FAD-dependent oxidoreductase [Arthrobacter sp. ISL-69]